MSKRQSITVDPAVAAILGEARDRTTQRRMKPTQRQTARRAQQRQSVTLELDRELVALVRDVASALEISPAGVVNRLLLDALTRYAAGQIDFDGYLAPSRSPRYAWVVKINPNGLQQAVHKLLTETTGEFEDES